MNVIKSSRSSTCVTRSRRALFVEFGNSCCPFGNKPALINNGDRIWFNVRYIEPNIHCNHKLMNEWVSAFNTHSIGHDNTSFCRRVFSGTLIIAVLFDTEILFKCWIACFSTCSLHTFCLEWFCRHDNHCGLSMWSHIE